MSIAVRRRSNSAERGVAGFLILLMLLLIGGAVLFAGLGTNSGVERKLALGESADMRLISARDALIGYAIGNIADASGRPGQFPAPDSLGDNNYDGNANNGSCLDSASAPDGLPALTVDSANYRCIGKLPWKTLGLSIDGVDEFDASGLVPWYAVSANLSANNSCLTYLNPQTLMSTPAGYSCPSNAAPPFPWLKVCDQSGQLLSDRVRACHARSAYRHVWAHTGANRFPTATARRLSRCHGYTGGMGRAPCRPAMFRL
jgi:hypothetical protein